MKVALTFFGQPRFIEKSFPYINECIIKPFKPDIFIHCWYDKRKIGQSYSCSFWNNGKSDIVKTNVEEVLNKLYSPKLSCFEPEKFNDENLIRDYSSHKAQNYSFITFSQAYTKLISNELKKQYERINNFKYDWVIKIRTDWKIMSIINLQEMDNTKVYVPDNCPNKNCFNDQFVVGNSENIDVYSSLFTNIDNYWVKDNIKLVDEEMITHHLQVNKISYQPIPIKHEIIRG